MEADEFEARALTARRTVRLEWYEAEIERRGKSFAQIWRDLAADPLKPWLATHASLEEYCEERWQMTPRRQRQIAAAESVKGMLLEATPELAGVVRNMPEGQARELTRLPAPAAAEVLREATKQPGKLTAQKIKQAKARVIGTEANLPMHVPETTSAVMTPSCCPTCGQPWDPTTHRSGRSRTSKSQS